LSRIAADVGLRQRDIEHDVPVASVGLAVFFGVNGTVGVDGTGLNRRSALPPPAVCRTVIFHAVSDPSCQPPLMKFDSK